MNRARTRCVPMVWDRQACSSEAIISFYFVVRLIDSFFSTAAASMFI
jgi:hypothetical protein